MARIYSDRDASFEPLKGKGIVVFGYGSQGRAQALNLKDSGLDVTICLKPQSASIEKAQGEEFRVLTDPKEAASGADVVVLLAPDEVQKPLWEEHLRDQMKKGSALLFAHGFNIHYKRILPRPDLDVILVSPKAVGQKVRSLYQEGRGAVCLLAVHQNATGRAEEIGIAYAKGIGGTRAGAIETTFEEETVTNLFGEQVVLCGGLTHLMQAGFETLVKAGYQPEVAYFETVQEVKLLTDLIYERGIAGMREAISNTAEYGDYTRGPRVIPEEARKAMEEILQEIRSGEFAREYVGEHEKGLPTLKNCREKGSRDLVEEIGKKVRSLR